MADKKRYHESVRDRMAESRGEERHLMKKHYYDDKSSYAGEQARRTQEMEDGGMLREDRNAVANMPQQVIYRAYEKNHSYLPEDIDDTIRGIDRQIDELDGGKVRRHMNPKKY